MGDASYGRVVPPDAGRRLLVGGGAAGVPVLTLLAVDAPVGLVVGALVFGCVYALAFAPERGTWLDHTVGGAAAGVVAWALASLTLYPVVVTAAPAWTPAGLVAAFPELVAWAVGGAGCGAVASVVGARVLDADKADAAAEDPPVETRVVVVGGGFAGVATVERLEERFGPDPTVELVLVSDTNALLFTPMLAEVAAGSLEPTQIMSPYRTTLRRTRVVTVEAVDADLDDGRLYVADADAPIAYDHLVLATGSTTNYFGMDNVRAVAFPFKTLADAVRLRNHVIRCFERAERIDDPARQRELLTFVVAGGGFAGTELAGALNDFAHELLAYHPYLSPEAVRVVLVHSGDRVMPALSASLSAYALDRLEERGVDVRLDTRVTGADSAAGVSLEPGGTVATQTLMWSAGVRPDPFIEQLDLPTVDSGAVRAAATFAVPGHDGVWAVGDCAAVEDPKTGERHPPTAQYATRAGTHLADNLYASVRGRDPEPFTYRSAGKLAVIGHNSACAEIAGRQFSGLFAWLLWRAIYLKKLPGADRRIRVSISWAVELLFPRDIVLAVTADEEVPRP